jgi:hypothetical protein
MPGNSIESIDLDNIIISHQKDIVARILLSVIQFLSYSGVRISMMDGDWVSRYRFLR